MRFIKIWALTFKKTYMHKGEIGPLILLIVNDSN